MKSPPAIPTQDAIMEMHQVHYFLAVARTCNFTRAAEERNISQPSLSRAIQALKAELGGSLFHRERGNTHLTELGRIIHPFMENIAAQTAAARTTAASYGNLDGAPLQIGVMCTIGPTIITGLITEFRQGYPEVEFVVLDRNARQLTEMLVSGAIDIAILGLPDAFEDRFHLMPLFEERFVVLLPGDHPLAGKAVVTGADLHGQLYVNRFQCEYLDFIGDEFDRRNIVVRRVFSSERDDWVKAMIRAGLGFGLFPEFSANDPDMIVRPLVEPEFVRRSSLITVRGRPHSPSVGAFVAAAKAYSWPGRL